MSTPSHQSLAHRAQKASGTGCLRLFFVPFFLAGTALFFFLTVRPVVEVLDARNWQETPCVIDSSRVVSHSGKGTTYSIEIVYHYNNAGRILTSKQYSFAVGATSGRSAKAAVVQRYPPGMETFCYVDPDAPEKSVIDRGFQGEFAFGAIGLVFALPGALGLIFAGRLSDLRRTAPGGLPAFVPGEGRPGALKPKTTPMGKFLGILIFSVIWNAFVGVFVYFVFFAEEVHQAPFFAKAIILLFALIGVATIIGVLFNFLALFNPRIHLTAPSTSVPLGGELSFTWIVTGRTGMLRKLRIVFEGREEATYKRGTSTSTDTRVFAELPVFETTEREFLTQGSARVVVPANLMHTFEGGRNKVLWRLKVAGEIPRWPDVADEYPIVVLPRPVAG